MQPTPLHPESPADRAARFTREIGEAEATLDFIYPDWRLPPPERQKRGGFTHLPPDQIEQVKRALKIRQMRINGKDGGVITTWSNRDGRPHPYVHPAPAGVAIVDTARLLSLLSNDPDLAAKMRAAGVLA